MPLTARPDATHPSPEEDGQSVGALLRSRRIAHGTSIEDIARQLRIRAVYLDAIEHARYEELPGLTYAIGFVRTYSDYVGLDPVEMVRRFKDETSGLERRTALSFPSPAPEGRVPGSMPLLIALTVAAILFGAWYSFRDEVGTLIARVPDVPERLASITRSVTGSGPEAPQASIAADQLPAAKAVVPLPTTEPIPSSPPQPQEPAALPVGPSLASPVAPPSAVPSASGIGEQSSTGQEEIPAPPVKSASTTPVGNPTSNTPGETSVAALPTTPQPAPPTATNLVVTTGEGRIFGAQNENARIIVRAKTESWVQVMGDRGQTIMLTRVMRQGDVYRVPNQSGLILITGNAGALEVEVDGTVAPSLGPVGLVRKNIPLDPEKLKAGLPPMSLPPVAAGGGSTAPASSSGQR